MLRARTGLTWLLLAMLAGFSSAAGSGIDRAHSAMPNDRGLMQRGTSLEPTCIVVTWTDTLDTAPALPTATQVPDDGPGVKNVDGRLHCFSDVNKECAGIDRVRPPNIRRALLERFTD